MIGAAHPAQSMGFRDYADGVVSGAIVANRYVRRAAERFHRDFETGEERGLVFDHAAAERAIRFMECLRHSKGKWRGHQLILSGWQRFIVANLFGWKWKASGFRRYKRAYIEIARKNGKSTLAAAIALYMLVADGEGAPEVYTAATSKEQAKIVFSECKRMVKACPALARRIAQYREQLVIDNLDAVLMPLHSASENLDGLNAHCGVVDEYHEHKDSETFDKIATSTGSRDQALVFIITTAGASLESACYRERAECINVIEGITSDDSTFVFIACMDDGDDWTDEVTWAKANPNLGISRSLLVMREDFAKASNSAKHEANFKRYFLNKWTNEETRWIKLDEWRACPSGPIDEEALRGEECYAGMDLSSIMDITAVVYFFPRTCSLVCRFFVPADNMDKREKRDKVPFSRWVAQGHMIKTTGNITDTNAIRETIRDDAQKFNVREIAFDRWNTLTLVPQLQEDGFTCVQFGQGFASMSAPSKEFMKHIVSRRLRHGGHPVLQWMASVVCVETDKRENIAPVKKASFERIDGIVCSVMAIGRAMVQVGDGKSVYETRGITVI